MKDFFYKYWYLFYILFFLLLGVLIYALLWQPNFSSYTTQINDLNQRLIECENRPVIDTTTTNRTIIECDQTVKSGGQGMTENSHDLGNKPGKVVLEFDMNQIPDELFVYLDGLKVASTNGLVSGPGSLAFDFDPNKNKSCTVIIKAPQENTEWKYLVNCPK
ncbi:hypothetical protein SAMN05443667_11924 [Flavobacterium gillisiae]|uniref:Uncharacterized protein n=1 Tax=Flavobacterium gillisiae TaxID=150146 RepID=A0A1H4GAD9_9FLAO|nr:hypothetical protein [Flavobacterium gillisiae]SEB06585.1 hypothetical protein SAMN05443667_11924 [Flavobacterium gillisiae]